MFKSVITPEMHYDDWARQYDSDVSGWDYRAPDRVLGGVREFLKTHPGPVRLLDVGIGTGLLSRKCRAVRPDIRVAGLDISSKMLDLCARSAAADELHRLDVEKDRFPFDDGQFDIAAASGLMETVGDIGNAIREMARVTRPGGLIAFTYMPTVRHPQREKLAKKLRPGRTQDGRMVMGDLNLFRYNPDSVALTARNAGVEAVHRDSFVGYRTYVVVAVRYDLFVGRKIRGILPPSPERFRTFSPD